MLSFYQALMVFEVNFATAFSETLGVNIIKSQIYNLNSANIISNQMNYYIRVIYTTLNAAVLFLHLRSCMDSLNILTSPKRQFFLCMSPRQLARAEWNFQVRTSQEYEKKIIPWQKRKNKLE